MLKASRHREFRLGFGASGFRALGFRFGFGVWGVLCFGFKELLCRNALAETSFTVTLKRTPHQIRSWVEISLLLSTLRLSSRSHVAETTCLIVPQASSKPLRLGFVVWDVGFQGSAKRVVFVSQPFRCLRTRLWAFFAHCSRLALSPNPQLWTPCPYPSTVPTCPQNTERIL